MFGRSARGSLFSTDSPDESPSSARHVRRLSFTKSESGQRLALATDTAPRRRDSTPRSPRPSSMSPQPVGRRRSIPRGMTPPTGSPVSQHTSAVGNQLNTQTAAESSVSKAADALETMESAKTSSSNVQGRVQAFVRIRPLNEKERMFDGPPCTSVDDDGKEITVLGKHNNRVTFPFDGIFPEHSTNADVFLGVGKPLVKTTLKGFNATLMAYGQTGSGKTHTLTSQDGLIPKMVEQLFQRIHSDRHHQYKVLMSYVQVYMERIFDLFDPSLEAMPLALRESPDKGVFIENVTEFIVENPIQVRDLLDEGRKRLVFAETKMNRQSSRSHALCMFVVEKTRQRLVNIAPDVGATEDVTDGHDHALEAAPDSSEGPENPSEPFSRGTDLNDDSDDDEGDILKDDMLLRGKLTLCDLGGSERVKKTEASGDRLSEAQNINLSLLELGNVVAALTNTSGTHVPYRNSALTRLLQDSLGGNAVTRLVVCVSPSARDSSETRCSLEFGSRAMCVQTAPRRNVDVDFKALAQDLAAQLATINEEWSVRERAVLDRLSGETAKRQTAEEENEKLRAKVAQLETERRMDHACQKEMFRTIVALADGLEMSAMSTLPSLQHEAHCLRHVTETLSTPVPERLHSWTDQSPDIETLNPLPLLCSEQTVEEVASRMRSCEKAWADLMNGQCSKDATNHTDRDGSEEQPQHSPARSDKATDEEAVGAPMQGCSPSGDAGQSMTSSPCLVDATADESGSICGSHDSEEKNEREVVNGAWESPTEVSTQAAELAGALNTLVKSWAGIRSATQEASALLGTIEYDVDRSTLKHALHQHWSLDARTDNLTPRSDVEVPPEELPNGVAATLMRFFSSQHVLQEGPLSQSPFQHSLEPSMAAASTLPGAKSVGSPLVPDSGAPNGTESDAESGASDAGTDDARASGCVDTKIERPSCMQDGTEPPSDLTVRNVANVYKPSNTLEVCSSDDTAGFDLQDKVEESRVRLPIPVSVALREWAGIASEAIVSTLRRSVAMPAPTGGVGSGAALARALAMALGTQDLRARSWRTRAQQALSEAASLRRERHLANQVASHVLGRVQDAGVDGSLTLEVDGGENAVGGPPSGVAKGEQPSQNPDTDNPKSGDEVDGAGLASVECPVDGDLMDRCVVVLHERLERIVERGMSQISPHISLDMTNTELSTSVNYGMMLALLRGKIAVLTESGVQVDGDSESILADDESDASVELEVTVDEGAASDLRTREIGVMASLKRKRWRKRFSKIFGRKRTARLGMPQSPSPLTHPT
eukprot:Rmarinus@m.24162